jgi:zinc protease
VVKKGEPLEPVRAALTQAVEDSTRPRPRRKKWSAPGAATRTSIERSLNDPQQVGVALSETIALGDWRLYFTGRDRVATITAEQVAAASSRYFRRDNRVTGSFIPTTRRSAPRSRRRPACKAC